MQLIKHDKNFDLLVVPGANHPAGRGNDPTAPYGDHKRFDFFVQHLLGVTPPTVEPHQHDVDRPRAAAVSGSRGAAARASSSLSFSTSSRSPPRPRASARNRRSTPDARLFEGLRFRNIGPAAMGGRIDDFAVLESNPAVFYVATATGGLWKTTNNGTTWEVLFDEQDDVVSIGDIAIAPTDANIVWVGTGENNNRQSSSWGNGVYKSTDGGHTWKRSGLADARHIARIIVDPVDHDVVYVAALGHLLGPNKERGVYKTTDGGAHLDQRAVRRRRHRRHRTGDGSVEQQGALRGHLSAPALVLGLQRRRTGQRDLQVHRRRPHLDEADQRHPRGTARPHRPRRLPRQPEHRLRPHRASEARAASIDRDDAGATWRKVSAQNPRPMYFSQIRIDPVEANRIYVLGSLAPDLRRWGQDVP